MADVRQCFWRSGGKFPAEFRGRCSHSQCVLGDLLVVIGGGFVPEGGAALQHCNDVLLLNLASQEYTVVEASPQEFTPRRGHSAVVKGEDEIVVFGGVTASERDPEAAVLLNDVAVFNVRTLSWSKPMCSGPLPDGRRGHAAVMHNDQMFVVGGLTPGVDPMIWILDTNNWEWEVTLGYGVAPQLHDIVASCKHENRLYIYGNGAMHGAMRACLVMVCLDLDEQEWHELPVRGSVATIRFCPAATLVLNRYFIVFGGSSGTLMGDVENLNSVMMFDLAQNGRVVCDMLSPAGQLPARRNGASICAVGDVAIVTGGGVYPEHYYDDIWLLEFRPPMPSFEASPRPTTAAVGTAATAAAAAAAAAAADTSIFNYFASLYREPRFSDVVLVLNEQRVPAHKVVLAARSEYFRSLFNGKFAEGVQGSSEIVLHDVAAEPFLHVLQFVYSDHPDDEIFASQDCLLSVLECAQMLRVEGLVTCIERHLLALAAGVTDWARYLPFLQVADTYELHRLYWWCMRCLHHRYHRARATQGDAMLLQRAFESEEEHAQAFSLLSNVTKQRIEQAETEMLSVSVMTSR